MGPFPDDSEPKMHVNYGFEGPKPPKMLQFGLLKTGAHWAIGLFLGVLEPDFTFHMVKPVKNRQKITKI